MVSRRTYCIHKEFYIFITIIIKTINPTSKGFAKDISIDSALHKCNCGVLTRFYEGVLAIKNLRHLKTMVRVSPSDRSGKLADSVAL